MSELRNQLTFRLGTEKDLKEISRLVTEAVCRMNSNGIQQWDDLYPTAEDFSADIAAGQLYVGMIDNAVAVVFTLNSNCDEAYDAADWQHPDASFMVLHRLCVNPEFQQRGVAKAVMAYAETVVKSKGISEIRLDVFERNPFAMRLYESCGYVRTGSADWRKGHFILMEKYLAEA